MITGNNNVAVGSFACYQGDGTAQRNTLVGYYAGHVASGSPYNCALGAHSLGSTMNDSDGSNVAIGFYSGAANTTGAHNIYIGREAGNTPNNSKIQTGDGNVIIGMKSPGEGDRQLQIASGDGLVLWITGGSMGVCYQGNNSSSWSTTSDIRLKREIGDYHKGLRQIKKLKVRTFRYTEDSDFNPEPMRQGFIAQEVEDIFPEMVSVDKKGFKAINTDTVLLALVNAVKELSDEVDKLKAERL